MEFKLSPLEEVLLQPVNYYVEQKGKNIRKHISSILGTILSVDENEYFIF